MAARKKAPKKRVQQKPPIQILGTGGARGAAEAMKDAERKRRKFLESI